MPGRSKLSADGKVFRHGESIELLGRFGASIKRVGPSLLKHLHHQLRL
jgi:hypothetical protein